MAEITLANGNTTKLDDADVSLVSGFRWHTTNPDPRKAYAVSETGGGRTYMHQLIGNPPRGLVVDHINRDPLDNRRSNLRIVTRSQNQANRIGWSRCGFRGVRADKNRWAAQITVDRHTRRLGSFKTPEDAARAYDLAAREIFGPCATLNYPD